MKHWIPALCCIFFVFFSSAYGLSVRNNDHGNSGLFGIKFGDTDQEFYAPVRQINSVSLQEYLTAAYKVTEIVIDIVDSSVQLRIYSTELLNPMEVADKVGGTLPFDTIQRPDLNVPEPLNRIKEGADSLGNLYVTKEYPVTTHAKTIEYRVKTRSELISFYRAFRNRWIKSKKDEEKEKEKEAEDAKAEGRPQTESATADGPRTLNGVLFVID